jgi:nucleotide-binding universal stress UspA family protein
MYDTIVVPTDGSEHALRASEHAKTVAGLFDATLHVLAVADIQRAAGPFDAGGVDEAFVERLEGRAQEAIDTIVAHTGTVPTETAIRQGEPREAIREYASEVDADMIAMGTHGRTGLHRYIVGSVTEGVVRLADRPVLTARTGDRRSEHYDEILLPIDGSDAAAAAIDHGIAIATAAGARLHVVNIVDIGALAARPSYTPTTGQFEQLRDDGERVTERVAQRGTEAGIDVTTTVTEGFPARDLLGYAEDHEIDLITMGTHGRTGLDRYLVGSTTERVIRHADRPVIAIPHNNKIMKQR